MKPSHSDYLLAAFLAPEERRALEESARGNPEAERMIAESRELEEALRKGAAPAPQILDAVAEAVCLIGPQDAPWRRALQERLVGIPAVRDRLDAMRREVARLEQGSAAEAHFNALYPGRQAARRNGAWMAAAAIVLLVAVHGAWSVAAEDPLRRAIWGQYRDPGAWRSAAVEADALAIARQAAVEARKTTLGMWPRYDLEALAQAEHLLADRGDPAALLERARLQLLQGHVELAYETLENMPQTDLYRQEREKILALMARFED